MSLNEIEGCVNFRDVGEWINEIAGSDLLPTNRILRGGKLTFVEKAHEIGSPGTIINVRKGPDPVEKRFGADYFHVPISNDYEKYETEIKEVRRWLNDIMRSIERNVKRYPIFIHCTSGKDRTGVVVASLLKILGIPETAIIEEYLLSDGEVRREWIEGALQGIGSVDTYFNRVDIATLSRKLLG